LAGDVDRDLLERAGVQLVGVDDVGFGLGGWDGSVERFDQEHP
jgi:hypothetical protein